MRKILDFIKENWLLMLTWNILIAIVFYAYGCEPKTQSLITPTQKVTLNELQTEIDILMLQSEARFADLQKQYELRDFVLNQSLTIAQAGTVNPIGLITSLLAIVGVGATADDIRLRRQRKKNGVP